MFSLIDSLICEYTDTMNIICQSCFTLLVRHVGWMNTQVWLLNSLVGLAGWVNSELVGSMRNTEQMNWTSCSIQYTMSKCLLKCLTFCLSTLPARIAKCSFQNHRNLISLEITVLARIAESQDCRMFGNKNNFRCQSSQQLTVACHRHPTEKTRKARAQKKNLSHYCPFK